MEEKSVEGRKSGSSLVRRNINGRGGANLTDTPLEKFNKEEERRNIIGHRG